MIKPILIHSLVAKIDVLIHQTIQVIMYAYAENIVYIFYSIDIFYIIYDY